MGRAKDRASLLKSGTGLEGKGAFASRRNGSAFDSREKKLMKKRE
jgi:hypothetical protein